MNTLFIRTQFASYASDTNELRFTFNQPQKNNTVSTWNTMWYSHSLLLLPRWQNIQSSDYYSYKNEVC